MHRCLLFCAIGASAFALAAQGSAQTTDSGSINAGRTAVVAPPSVDNGVANGVLKSANAPSVSNGVSNGIVKQPGAPSVGNGIGNGVVKSSTVNQ